MCLRSSRDGLTVSEHGRLLVNDSRLALLQRTSKIYIVAYSGNACLSIDFGYDSIPTSSIYGAVDNEFREARSPVSPYKQNEV
jgi:hypothetical protein